jgi:plastocyanin
MKPNILRTKPFRIVCMGLALAVVAVPRAVQAQENWQAKVGAESPDMGKQALAFLPNEIWIHAGDSITWTFNSDEIHTATFLTVGQNLSAFPSRLPGILIQWGGFRWLFMRDHRGFRQGTHFYGDVPEGGQLQD